MINNIINFINELLDYFILTFDKAGTVQLISSVIVLFSAYIAFVSTKRKTAIDIITKNRIDWTNLVREKASEIISLSHKIADILNLALKNKQYPENAMKEPGGIEEFANNIHKLNGLVVEFKLYFNPFDCKDKVVLDLIDEIDYKIDKFSSLDDYQMLINLIKKFSRELSILLKNEWEQIKKEAGIKRSLYGKVKKLYTQIRLYINKKSL